MRAEKLDHLGIKVTSIDTALPAYVKLGFRMVARRLFPEVGMEIAFLELGSLRMELLETMSPSSPLRTAPEGLHHVAFFCTDVSGAFQELSQDPRYTVFGPPFTGALGNPAFLCRANESNTLLEVVGAARIPNEEPEIWRW